METVSVSIVMVGGLVSFYVEEETMCFEGVGNDLDTERVA
jgi:hypothetical protein